MARKTLVGCKNNKNSYSMNLLIVLEINYNYHEFRFEDTSVKQVTTYKILWNRAVSVLQ